MKKIYYNIGSVEFDLSEPLYFHYGPDELEDFSTVEIVPVDSEGQQIKHSVYRNVVLVNRQENGFPMYKATVHIQP